jgi:hypothetical protein
VVTADVLWLDSLPAEELDSLEDSLPAEDELLVGVLEVVEDPVPFEVLDEAAVFPPAAVVACVLGVVAVFFVERAGSCPEASCTYTARNAALNSAAARAATERRRRCTRRRSAERRLLASARASSCSGERLGGCCEEGLSVGSMVAPIGGLRLRATKSQRRVSEFPSAMLRRS